jgi:hypothetical protein
MGAFDGCAAVPVVAAADSRVAVGPPPHAAIEAARSRVISAILARRKVVSFPGDTVRAGSRYVLWMKRR